MREEIQCSGWCCCWKELIFLAFQPLVTRMRRRTWANQAPPQTFLNSLRAADAIVTPARLSEGSWVQANFGARTIQLKTDLIEISTLSDGAILQAAQESQHQQDWQSRAKVKHLGWASNFRRQLRMQIF